MIRAVNWNPRVAVPIATAVKVLSSLEIAFTNALAAATPFLPDVVWVRLAPPTPLTTVAAPTLAPVLALHGTTSISGDLVIWRLSDPPTAVSSALASGGLILIDLDCDYLADSTGVDVSGSAALLTGLKPPVRPGGIFRTWIQVAAG